MKIQAGFTLIELVMVIIILGVLAAIAVPKFVDLGGDAGAKVDLYNAGDAHEKQNTDFAKCVVANGGSATTPTNCGAEQ